MIPKIVHYCFGMSPDFDGKPWSLIHHVCLRSAIERIRPTDVRFYCEYEPAGPWWELSRSLVNVETTKAPREIFGNPLVHAAHRADVVRLEKLLMSGGIYLDADVFVHDSFDGLVAHAAVLGEEHAHGGVVGLCNAVVLAESGSPFLTRWYAAYQTFRSKGRDEYWDEHSVKIPYALSQQFPNEITTLPHSAFFWPTFTQDNLALIFASHIPIDLSKTYTTHLWESRAWEDYLEHLTPGRVRALDTNFHRWARPMLAALPDDYGCPAATARFVSNIRRLRRRVSTLKHGFITRVPRPTG
jgi:Glycosyltransferase sugar-binding region containing DXD motif